MMTLESAVLTLFEDDEILNENKIDESFAQTSVSSKLRKRSKKAPKVSKFFFLAFCYVCGGIVFVS